MQLFKQLLYGLLIVFFTVGCNTSTFAEVEIEEDFVDESVEFQNRVACSYPCILVIKDDGTVWGKFGVDENAEYHYSLTQVESLVDIMGVATDGKVNLALDRNGYVWRFDLNEDNSLSAPEKVDGFDLIVKVYIQDGLVTAIKADGTVWVYGETDKRLANLFLHEWITYDRSVDENFYIVGYTSVDDENIEVVEETLIINKPCQIQNLENIVDLHMPSGLFLDAEGEVFLSNQYLFIPMNIGPAKELFDFGILKEDGTVWHVVFPIVEEEFYLFRDNLKNIVHVENNYFYLAIDHNGVLWPLSTNYILDPLKVQKDTLVWEQDEWGGYSPKLEKLVISSKDSPIIRNVSCVAENKMMIVYINTDGTLWYYQGISFEPITEEERQNPDVVAEYIHERNWSFSHLKYQVTPIQFVDETGKPFTIFD